jgi:hypothetical protein
LEETYLKFKLYEEESGSKEAAAAVRKENRN